MNFLGKKIAILGDFSNFKIRESNFKKDEIEFYMAQLGAIISDYKKADFVLAGHKSGEEKIKFAKENNIPIIEIDEIERRVLADEKELLANPEFLKEIQNFLVENSPKYLGREIMDSSVKKLIEKKLQDPKISKAWIKQFYENIFISSLPKEKMVMLFSSQITLLKWIEKLFYMLLNKIKRHFFTPMIL